LRISKTHLLLCLNESNFTTERPKQGEKNKTELPNINFFFQISLKESQRKKPGSAISPNEEIKKYKRKESLIKSREEMAKYLGKKELKIGKIENRKR
jgi:hypothetical protein